MEEQTTNTSETNAPTQPPTGRFMDIQSPGNNSGESEKPAEQPAEVVISPEGQLSEATPAPTEPAAVSPQPEAINVPVNQAAPESEKPAEQPASNPEPASHEAPEPSPNQPEHPVAPPTPHHTPLIAVLVALVITIGLCGLVVYAYLKSKDKPTTTKTTTTTTPAPVAKPQASPQDIDQVTTDIDQSLTSLDDAADFSANAISNQALGL